MLLPESDRGKRLSKLEKRKVTVRICGQSCSFYSDDPDEYISALERRANAVMKQTSRYAGPSVSMNAILSVVSLTDALLRMEEEQVSEEQGKAPKIRKHPPKTVPEDLGQVSVWELLSDSASS